PAHHGPAFVQAAAERTFEIERAEAADRCGSVTVGFRGRPARLELDDAGRGIAAEQRALRSAQDFDAVDVEQREALQDYVFLHDLIDDHRDRLRGRKIEVRVAE